MELEQRSSFLSPSRDVALKVTIWKPEKARDALREH
jgi:hypothetical protein